MADYKISVGLTANGQEWLKLYSRAAKAAPVEWKLQHHFLLKPDHVLSNLCNQVTYRWLHDGTLDEHGLRIIVDKVDYGTWKKQR